MRVLQVSQWFQPEAAFKGLPFASALRDRGHEVEVLTGFPNYPIGKVYPGYRVRPYQREVLDGITVHRVPLYPSHDGSGIRRSWHYLSFALSATALGPVLVQRPDVIYVYNLPTLMPAARLLRRVYGAPVVLDVQDPWPEAVSYSKMITDGLLLSVISRWCRAQYRSADRLTVLSPSMQSLLCERGVPADRIRVIYNWCDEATLTNCESSQVSAEPTKANRRFNVVFAGTMGRAQALEGVVKAAAVLSDRAPDVQFTFVGGGTDVARLRGIANGLPNVEFLPMMPPSEVGPLLSAADLLLVHLMRDALLKVIIPSKIQTYLYAGKPILNAVAGDAADLIARSGGGMTCTAEDPESIAAGVLAMRALSQSERVGMGRRSRAFYDRELSLRAGVAAFEQEFYRAIEGQ